MHLNDGEMQADAGVTDFRLFGDDHATALEARLRPVNQWIADSHGTMLSVGLTRRPSLRPIRTSSLAASQQYSQFRKTRRGCWGN